MLMCPVIFCRMPVVVTDLMATINGIHKACICVADVVATE